ncbi:MAG TPA: MBL fold metallo-hydrolase [Thermoanaerobaculia bacterium]|nr:MBL fold metallo-hydrolase [Thermoanaerobaculia bacterium]
MRVTCRREVLAAALAVLLLSGCGHVISGALTGGDAFDFAQKHECVAAQPAPGQVEVRYLGSGGVYVEWRGDAILIGPSFSNPSLLRAAFGQAKFDEGRIARALGVLDLTKVRAILAAHSHYDHIGDLPVVATHPRLTKVPIYVNASGMNMLHSEPQLLARAEKLAHGTAVDVGQSIRVRALLSTHAPQLCRWRRWPCVYAAGDVEKEWSGKWTDHFLQSFRGGEPLAFEIELWDEHRLRYRIYYNDAASDGATRVTGKADLAILCMAQWSWAREYPVALLGALQPKHVVVSHWDDFFSKAEGTSRFVPLMSNRSAERFLAAVNDGVDGNAGPTNEVCGVRTERWTMPTVGSAMLFTPE